MSGIVLTADHNYDIWKSLDLKKLFPNYKRHVCVGRASRSFRMARVICTIIESENENGVCNKKKKLCLLTWESHIVIILYTYYVLHS